MSRDVCPICETEEALPHKTKFIIQCEIKKVLKTVIYKNLGNNYCRKFNNYFLVICFMI